MAVRETREQIRLDGAAPIDVRILRDAGRAPGPLVLHLPGGAFMTVARTGPLATLLAEAGAVVVSADYPTGRAHPFPAAADALYALLCHLHRTIAQRASRRSPLLVAGEEAGGNLAAALSLMARDRLGPPLAGQILISPMLDAGMATCSFRDAEAGPVGCPWADGWAAYLGRADAAAHPYAVPARSTRLQRLPPALLITTPDDPVRDECLAYAGRLERAGVPVHAHCLAADAWAGPARPIVAGFLATLSPGPAPGPTPNEASP